MPASDALACARWEALGTSVVLQLNHPDALVPARSRVQRELHAIDLACSRFRGDSELSYLNAHAGRTVAANSSGLAVRAAQLTGGDVDPTVGRALVLAGYDRDWRLLARPGEQPERPAVVARVRAGWRSVGLDRTRSSIRIPAGVRLDLGATAKAWAADRAAAAGLGGDIATSGCAPEGGWRIRVTDDHRSDASAPGQTISICSGGLATSSTAVRRWSHRGQNMHHIIDPHTGAPSRTSWRTVSVAAANCAEANIATTAALVRDEAAVPWLTGLGLPARLVDRRGRIATIGGWPVERRQGVRRP